MPKVTFSKKPRSSRASYVPGDNLRVLTRPATDIDLRVWPSGTKFRVLCAGVCGMVVYVIGDGAK